MFASLIAIANPKLRNIEGGSRCVLETGSQARTDVRICPTAPKSMASEPIAAHGASFVSMAAVAPAPGGGPDKQQALGLLFKKENQLKTEVARLRGLPEGDPARAGLAEAEQRLKAVHQEKRRLEVRIYTMLLAETEVAARQAQQAAEAARQVRQAQRDAETAEILQRVRAARQQVAAAAKQAAAARQRVEQLAAAAQQEGPAFLDGWPALWEHAVSLASVLLAPWQRQKQD